MDQSGLKKKKKKKRLQAPWLSSRYAGAYGKEMALGDDYNSMNCAEPRCMVMQAYACYKNSGDEMAVTES